MKKANIAVEIKEISYQICSMVLSLHLNSEKIQQVWSLDEEGAAP
jgi:hypothetical protein